MFDFVRNLSKSEAEKRQEALSAYLDDTLSGRQRQAFEQQLAHDPDLRRELEALRLIRQQMRALPRRSVPRSFTLDTAVYGKPRKEPLVQAYPVLRAATAMTAFFFVAALAFSLFNLGGLSGSGATAPMAAEAPAQESEIAAAPESALRQPTDESATSGMMQAAEAPVEATVIVTEEMAEDSAAEEMPAGDAGLALAVPTATPAPLATQSLPAAGAVPEESAALATAVPSELPRPEATELADIARAATVAPYEPETANTASPFATAVSEQSPAPAPAPISLWLTAALGGLLLILLVLIVIARRRL